MSKLPRVLGLQETERVIRDKCVLTKRTDRLISRKGSTLGWLIDMRPAFLNPHVLHEIASEFWHHYASHLPFQLAGMEVAAIPLLTALLLRARELDLTVNGLILRKQRKADGRGRSIEGFVGRDPVVIIDDTFNSGQSFAKAKIVLESHCCVVKGLFAVIDYRSAGGQAWCASNGLSVDSLFQLSDFGLEVSEPKAVRHSQNYVQTWAFMSKGGHPFNVNPKSAPVICDGVLYYGTEDGRVLAINATDGSCRWEVRIPNTGRKGIWSSPETHRDWIFVGAYNGNVYCLSREDGSIVWCNHACEWVGSSPLCVPELGLVYVGLEYERPNLKGGIAAFDVTDGDKQWEYPLQEYQHGSSVYFSPNRSIITGTNDHSVVSLDAKSGNHIWTFPTRRSVKYAPAVDLEHGLTAFASSDQSIYILNAFDGQKRLEIETEGLCYTTPLLANGRLFCGSGDRHLYVVDLATLKPIGRLDLKARVYANPIIAGRLVVVGTTGGIVFLIDQETLEVKDRILVPDAVTNRTISQRDGEELYIPTYMNDLFKFKRLGSVLQPAKPNYAGGAATGSAKE